MYFHVLTFHKYHKLTDKFFYSSFQHHNRVDQIGLSHMWQTNLCAQHAKLGSGQNLFKEPTHATAILHACCLSLNIYRQPYNAVVSLCPVCQYYAAPSLKKRHFSLILFIYSCMRQHRAAALEAAAASGSSSIFNGNDQHHLNQANKPIYLGDILCIYKGTVQDYTVYCFLSALYYNTLYIVGVNEYFVYFAQSQNFANNLHIILIEAILWKDMTY